MEEKRNKKRVTTYFKKDSLKQVDNYCKKANIRRSDFLEIAAKTYINSIENDLNLLSFAYHAYSYENWTQVAKRDTIRLHIRYLLNTYHYGNISANMT